MGTENARNKYTAMTTMAGILSSELNALANNGAALDADAESNDADASGERLTLRNFQVYLGVQTARTGDGTVSLLIVPEGVTSQYGDVDAADPNLASSYIARRDDGSAVTWTLPNSTAAVRLTAANVRIPMGNYKVGLLNRSSQALAATGNTVHASGAFTSASYTE